MAKKKEPNILEGFTYEEIPAQPNQKEVMEIPQEMIDSSTIIDLSEIQAEEPIISQIEKPVLKDPRAAKVSIEEPKEELKKNKSEVEFELPNIKEPKENAKPAKESTVFKFTQNKRNLSRKISLGKRVIDIDECEISDTVQIDYYKYSEILRDYFIKKVVAIVLDFLQTYDVYDNDQLFKLLRENIHHHTEPEATNITKQFPEVDNIKGETQLALIPNRKNMLGQTIAIAIKLTFYFKDHNKTYNSTDIIEIPA